MKAGRGLPKETNEATVRAYNVEPEYVLVNRMSANATPFNPRPSQGVGEFGRPRVARTHEIAGSNPAALTITITSTTTQR